MSKSACLSHLKRDDATELIDRPGLHRMEEIGVKLIMKAASACLGQSDVVRAHECSRRPRMQAQGEGGFINIIWVLHIGASHERIIQTWQNNKYPREEQAICVMPVDPAAGSSWRLAAHTLAAVTLRDLPI